MEKDRKEIIKACEYLKKAYITLQNLESDLCNNGSLGETEEIAHIMHEIYIAQLTMKEYITDCAVLI